MAKKLRLFAYVKPGYMSLLLQRKDGFWQHYLHKMNINMNIDHEPDDPDDYFPEIDDKTPEDTTFVDGTPEEMVERLEEEFKHLFHKDPPPWTWAKTEEEVPAAAQSMNQPAWIVRRTSAFYSPKLHRMYGGPKLYRRLNSWRFPGLQTRGLRTLVHEFFHLIRPDAESFQPFEEAGAEIFADYHTQRLTGLDVTSARIETYKPFVEGVELILQVSKLELSPLDWMMQSRNAPHQKNWFISQLRNLGFLSHEIQQIMHYNVESNIQREHAEAWLKQVREACERMRGEKS